MRPAPGSGIWVNLGLAYNQMRNYDDAARIFLNALSLNPEAKHVWELFQTALLGLNRYDLVKKL